MDIKDSGKILLISLLFIIFAACTKSFNFITVYGKMFVGWLSASISLSLLLILTLSVLSDCSLSKIPKGKFIIAALFAIIAYAVGISINAFGNFNKFLLIRSFVELVGFSIILFGSFAVTRKRSD